MRAMLCSAFALALIGACVDETIGEVSGEQRVRPTPEAGQSCHVNATGVYNGTMNQNGWCCGTAVGDDGAEHYTCSACDYYSCQPGPDLTRTTTPPPNTPRP